MGAQWVKPLVPGQIPKGTVAEWNTVTQQWDFVPLPDPSPDDPPIPEPTPTEQAILKRDGLLAASDYTQLPDAPFTEQQKQAWAVYRQELRDLPSQPGFPNVPFPTPPSA